MERLDLKSAPQNPLIEAAIHLARYANIAPYVKDKVVLDAACGEGYGSALLMRAGAKRVVGVDVSADAIASAQSVFAASGAEYIVADVADLTSMFATDTFDIIVSIETIEHVSDPEQLLRSMVHVGRQGAILYVTCPNDRWYYPSEDQKNPFHLRKYTFAEFEEMSTRVLGSNVQWGLGSVIFGFGTAPLDTGTSYPTLGASWVKCSSLSPAYMIANSDLAAVGTGNCSYFVGIWNLPGSLPAGAAYIPINMDSYTALYEAVSEGEAFRLREAKHLGLKLSAVEAENKVIRQNLGHSQYECHVLKQRIEELNAQHSDALKDKNQSIDELKAQSLQNQAEISALTRRVHDMEVGYRRYARLSKRVPEFVKRIVRSIRAG